ncbi:cation-efflux pump [Methylocella sp.]|uniref:cation-efflux pump n=1 Tax=Methylocella sp. TaxID=1978226 RepID=UPI0037836802
MSHPPSPAAPGSAPGGDRGDAQARKERVALVSIFISLGMACLKLAAGVVSGSLAVMSEAGNNFGDVVTTTLTYFAIRVSNKPADDDHPYGHGKVEPLAALIETGFLFALAAFILIEATRRFLAGDVEVEASPLVFAVLFGSIAVDSWRWRVLSRVARDTGSEALAADALNFSSDIVASSLAILGLAAARFGYPQGDAVAALCVAGFIGVAGFNIGRRTVSALTDAAPHGLTEKVWRVAAEVQGVIRIDSLRLRPAGAEVLGELEIAVPRTLAQEHVATIKARAAGAVRAAHPEVSLTVGARPVALDSETILERILLIAAKRRVPIHHVTAQEIAGHASVSFDLEVDGRMSLGDAHEIASILEAEIRRELGANVEVESHIEPLEPRQLPGADAPAETLTRIEQTLGWIARELGAPSNVHDVRVRETPAGLFVNYHCCVDPELSVDAAHEQVDALERKARAAFPQIMRIVGHAEPESLAHEPPRTLADL